MDLNDIFVFTRVVQAGSFTRGAKILGLPKSTVSRRVAELEKRLGVSLLHRTTRNLRITDVGSIYYEHGMKIVAEAEKAEALITNLQSIPQGTLRITAPVDFGNRFLGKIISDFIAIHKKVKVDVVLTQRVVDLIGEGFDLGIRIGDLEDSSLMSRRLGRVDLQLYASPTYLEKHGTPLTCSDLSKHQCIYFTADGEKPAWHLIGPKNEEKVIQVNGRISANDLALVHEFAVNGEGIVLMPYFMCAEDLRTGRLQIVLKNWTSASGVIHAVFPGQRYLLPKVRAFVEHLSIHFQKYQWK